MDDLTQREKSVIGFIATNIKTKGYPPSVREIGQAVGLKSSSTVHGYLKRLEAKGYIRRDPAKPRAMEIMESEYIYRRDTASVPILGQVAAGQPMLASESYDESLPISTAYFGEGKFFMLKVRGDSMIDAGIHQDDLVVVRQQSNANNGDIVVAMIDDEATVKRFFKENSHIRLQPENKNLEPILIKDVSVLGKVIGLMRRY
jgi:repressor LexA